MLSARRNNADATATGAAGALSMSQSAVQRDPLSMVLDLDGSAMQGVSAVSRVPPSSSASSAGSGSGSSHAARAPGQ